MPGIKTPVLLCFVAVAACAQMKTEEGIQFFHQGRYSSALQLLKDARDQQGRSFRALSEAALGDCKTALPELVKTQDQDQVLQRLTGVAAVKCLSSTGDEAAALGLLQRLQKQFPRDPDLLYIGAKLHMKAFNDATVAMFREAPASYRVHELSAEIFEVDNRFGEAVSEYRKAIELNPKAPDLHFRLGRAILLQSHDARALEKAADEFQSELKLSPEDSASEFQLGQIAQVKGDTSEAKTRFQRALRLTPDFVAAMVALAKTSASEKAYPAAIDLLNRAILLQPENETAHYALMTAYRDNGQMKEAKAEKGILDRLQKPPEGEFSDFLKKLGEKPPAQ